MTRRHLRLIILYLTFILALLGFVAFLAGVVVEFFSRGAPLPDRDADDRGARGDQRDEQPDGPTAREDELGTFIGGSRVLEEELEHPAHLTLTL